MKNIEQTKFNKIFDGIIGFYQFIELNDIYLVFTKFYKELTKQEFNEYVKEAKIGKYYQSFASSTYFSDGWMDNESVMDCVQNYDQLPLFMLDKADDYISYGDDTSDHHITGNKETMDLVNFLNKLNPSANALELVSNEVIAMDNAQNLEKTLHSFSNNLIKNGYSLDTIDKVLEFNKLLNNSYANVRLPSNKGWTFKELKQMGYNIPGLSGWDYLYNKNQLINIWNINNVNANTSI